MLGKHTANPRMAELAKGLEKILSYIESNDFQTIVMAGLSSSLLRNYVLAYFKEKQKKPPFILSLGALAKTAIQSDTTTEKALVSPAAQKQLIDQISQAIQSRYPKISDLKSQNILVLDECRVSGSTLFLIRQALKSLGLTKVKTTAVITLDRPDSWHKVYEADFSAIYCKTWDEFYPYTKLLGYGSRGDLLDQPKLRRYGIFKRIQRSRQRFTELGKRLAQKPR